MCAGGLTAIHHMTYPACDSDMTQRSTRAYPNLKTWRAAKHLSTYKAADLLGISQSTYSRLERGKQAVRGPLAKRITERAGVPLEVLVGAA